MITIKLLPNRGAKLQRYATQYFLITVIFCINVIKPSLAENSITSPLNIKYAYVHNSDNSVNLKENYDLELYFYEMLKLALKKSDVSYRLQTLTTNVMVNERKNILLKNGDLDTHWLSS